MKKNKFMTRIFSAMENQEDAVLNQIQNDLEIAKEDGSLESDQYNITYKGDDTYEVEDKVNNETTIVKDDDNDMIMVDSEDLVTEPNPEVELGGIFCDKFKNFSVSSIRQFSNDLIGRIGKYDVKLDLENNKFEVLDEDIEIPFNPKDTINKVVEQLKKDMKKNGLKVFSNESGNETFSGGSEVEVKTESKTGGFFIAIDEALKSNNPKAELKKIAESYGMKLKDLKEPVEVYLKYDAGEEDTKKILKTCGFSDSKFSKFSPNVAKMFATSIDDKIKKIKLDIEDYKMKLEKAKSNPKVAWSIDYWKERIEDSEKELESLMNGTDPHPTKDYRCLAIGLEQYTDQIKSYKLLDEVIEASNKEVAGSGFRSKYPRLSIGDLKVFEVTDKDADKYHKELEGKVNEKNQKAKDDSKYSKKFSNFSPAVAKMFSDDLTFEQEMFSRRKRDLLGKDVEVWMDGRQIDKGKVDDIKRKDEINISDNTDYEGPYYRVNGTWYQDDPDHSYTSYIKVYSKKFSKFSPNVAKMFSKDLKSYVVYAESGNGKTSLVADDVMAKNSEEAIKLATEDDPATWKKYKLHAKLNKMNKRFSKFSPNVAKMFSAQYYSVFIVYSDKESNSAVHYKQEFIKAENASEAKNTVKTKYENKGQRVYWIKAAGEPKDAKSSAKLNELKKEMIEVKQSYES